jgi:hypothetical protein
MQTTNKVADRPAGQSRQGEVDGDFAVSENQVTAGGHKVLKIWIAVVALGAALPAFALGQVIWKSPVGSPTPPAQLLPLFVAETFVEALSFGVGVAFLVFGYSLVRRAALPSWLTIASYMSLGWLLVQWWPHGNLHRVVGNNWTGLLEIEWGFHATMAAAMFIVAYFFVRTLSSQRGSTRAPA